MVAALVRGLWWCSAFTVALAASLLVGVRDASACSPPPAGWFPSGIIPAPSNGVVLLRYACISNCETLPDLGTFVLKGSGDASVPGSVVFSQARTSELVVGFRPDAALPPGSTYTAELGGVPLVSGILIGPAVTWNDALTVSDDIFEVDLPTGEPVCCSGPLDSCGYTPCFRPQVARRTAVAVGWYDPQSIEHYQYAFRLGRESIDPAAPWSWDGGDTRFELDPTEDSACYVLELKRLTDDFVQTFASRCIEQPSSFTPGPHPASADDIAAVLQGCTEPPDHYESAWCDARGELCELSPDEAWCADLAARCSMLGAAGAAGGSGIAGAPGDGGTAGTGGATSNGGSGGATGGKGGKAGSSGTGGGTAGRTATGGSTAVGGTGGTSDAGAPDGEAGEAGAGQRVYTKGCGCSTPGDASSEPASFALALAVLAFRLRRRNTSRVAS